MRGITKPLVLQINQFKCVIHLRKKREFCGAAAFTEFMRDNFGIDYAKEYGFKMSINLKMRVEALLEYDLY